MAITAARMSSRFQRLALKATITASVAFVVGMTIAVITESPII
jgi:ABC-type Mn2+/Zn2+ transport system permease subunit